MNDDRAKLDARKERYLRDPLPARLGNLASNLARIKSIATHPDLGEAAKRVIRESKYFVEWAGKDADLQVQIELVELQRQLARWQFKWNEIWNDIERRASLAEQAGAWSQKIPESCGGDRYCRSGRESSGRQIENLRAAERRSDKEGSLQRWQEAREETWRTASSLFQRRLLRQPALHRRQRRAHPGRHQGPH